MRFPITLQQQIDTFNRFFLTAAVFSSRHSAVQHGHTTPGGSF